MPILIGHNDSGYPPDEPPLQVPSVQAGIQVLINQARRWFSPIVDDDDGEMTHAELAYALRSLYNLRPGARIILRGHQFWMREATDINQLTLH